MPNALQNGKAGQTAVGQAGCRVGQCLGWHGMAWHGMTGKGLARQWHDTNCITTSQCMQQRWGSGTVHRHGINSQTVHKCVLIYTDWIPTVQSKGYDGVRTTGCVRNWTSLGCWCVIRHCWIPFGAVGCHWAPFEVFGCCWMSLGTAIGCHWVLLDVVGRCWMPCMFITSTGCKRP